jgi:hypothetical protein
MPSRAFLSTIDPIPLNYITLPAAVKKLTAKILDSDVSACLDQTQDLLRDSFGLPTLNNYDIKQTPSVPSSPSVNAWKRRELAIRQIRKALCDGDLLAVVFDSMSRQPFLLEPVDWRAASLIDQTIRGGIIHARPGESIGRHAGSRVLITERDFRRWLKLWKPLSVSARAPTRHACLNWLRDQMLANPERSAKTQKGLFVEANERFNVSWRSFKEIWKEARQATGARWGAGRPSKSAESRRQGSTATSSD